MSSLTHLLLDETKSALYVLVNQLQRCPEERNENGKSKYLHNPDIEDDRAASVVQDATS